MMHECHCGGSNSRVIRHPELSRSSQELIMADECCCGGSNSRVMRHSELSQGAQHTEETRKIHHKNSSTESVVEDDVDAELEQRLRLIRQRKNTPAIKWKKKCRMCVVAVALIPG